MVRVRQSPRRESRGDPDSSRDLDTSARENTQIDNTEGQDTRQHPEQPENTEQPNENVEANKQIYHLPPDGEVADSLYPLLSILKKSNTYPLSKEKREITGRTFAAINARVMKAGCSPEEIAEAVEVALSGDMNKQCSNKLFTFLHPITTVNENTIISILGSLGASRHKLADTTTQAAGLKWLVAVLEWIDSTARRTLGNMYAVLWNHLGIETLRYAVSCRYVVPAYSLTSLRPHLPYLLALLTRREHVIPFRVSFILTLQARFPLDPSLPALINVFRSYHPTRIPPGIGRAAGKRPYRVNANWKQKSRAIREGTVEEYEEQLIQKRQERAERNAKQTTSEILQQSLVPQKRQRIEYAAPPLSVMQSRGSIITIQDCPTLRTLGKYFDRLTMPSQVAALLQNNFATWAYLAHPTDKNTRQLSAWLSHALKDAIVSSPLTQDNYEASEEFLRLVVAHCRYTKQLSPLLEAFVVDFLETWDGAIFQTEIFELISYYPPRPFQVIHELVLQPLARLSAYSGLEFRIRVVKCYNALLRQWSCYNWSRMRQTYITLADDDAKINWQYVNTLMVEHVEMLGELIYKDHPNNAAVHHVILDTIEATTPLMTSIQDCSIKLPNTEMFFTLIQNGGVEVISRLCAQICNWREIMTVHGDLLKEGRVSEYPPAFKKQFHEWVLATCEFFYRMKAFDPISRTGEWVSGLGRDVLERLHKSSQDLEWGRYQLSIKAVGDVAFNPRLVPLSQRFLGEFQDYFNVTHPERYEGAVSNSALKGSSLDMHGLNIRANYVEWLGRQGVTGLPMLLFTTVKSLQTFVRGHESSFLQSQSQENLSPRKERYEAKKQAEVMEIEPTQQTEDTRLSRSSSAFDRV
ncbi:hypothetical protein E3P81_02993 [Wallemia ichthyophaga]|nr:hypothetical protein E3P97_03127 [Wallemia ichthyophaga]TIB30223.1 hypothetical protein E3P85_02822 [Wallemia ichthyophaga]TIB45129.1 hypothetical protein E3P82_03053 [Wallemia ichthyophaga]TIB48161.1 hypothetical protein E3P81_02993 [Wallemia ichthyophaga]TIB51254.1 hypothetical protein E3P80_03058 [Wallemia ichthyophaga]